MRRLLSVMVALAMVVGLSITAPAVSDFSFEQRTVRVGISPFPHFSEIDAQGGYSGILIDYLTEIKKYTGWELEYVVTEPSAAIHLLDTGEIDLLGGMIKNNQTMELYGFAEIGSGYAYSTITVKNSHTEYVPNDYGTFKGITVGVYSKAISRIEAFEQFRSQNGLDITPVYFEDSEAWEEAFRTGQVDAQLTSSAKLREDEKIIASFKREPYYFGVSKGNTGILRELNHALELINQTNPNFDTQLYKKHFSDSGYGSFSLTESDKKFINEHPVLRVAAAPDWRPIGYLDEAGDFSGISANILDVISEKTGFTLRYLPTESLQQGLELLKTNQVDMLVGVMPDGLGAQAEGLAFSLPYLPIQTVLLHHGQEDIKQQKAPVMAVACGFEFPILENCVLRHYDRAEDAIEAVKQGKADFTVTSNLIAEGYMAQSGKGGLHLVPLSGANSPLTIAYNTPANPTLLTIMDRAIFSISDAQRQAFVFENTALTGETTLVQFIYANPIRAIFIITVAGLLILLLLFLFMNMRLRLSRKNAVIADTYRIIGELSAEYIFAYDFETGKLSLPESFAKLVGVPATTSREECNQEGGKKLFAAFEDSQAEPNFSVEFDCGLSGSHNERFRAICAIIYDGMGHPVRGIGKLVSIQAELEEKQRLESLLNTDALTGLYSKHCCEQLSSQLAADNGDGRPGALMLIDIDNFKEINGTLGHLGGDEVLKHFSRTLETVFHSGEILGRWGGDEFLVFIEDAQDRASVEKRVQKLCTNVNDEFTYGDATVELSVSVGIAFSNGTTGFRQVFQQADDALYQVKRGKKNGYQFA